MSNLVLASPSNGLIAAIAAVMCEVDVVAKRGINQFHGYHFARVGDILEKITPLLGKHGIVVFQTETGRAMFDGENVIAVEYAFTVVHISGERWPEPVKQTGVSRCRDSKGGWDDKSLAKCHTAARKYFLLSLFQIPTGDEADADVGEIDHVQPRRVVTAPPPRQRREPRTVVPSPKRIWEAELAAARTKPVLVYDDRNPPPRDEWPEGK